MHCTVRSPASGSVSSTATRPRACPSHCHSALNATCSTFTGEWQCGMHCHSAPSVPRPHPFTATRLRAYRFGTLTPVWQSRSHCHSAPSVPRPHPFTATRPRSYRLHCQSTPSVLGHPAIISVSILRAGSRPRLYRSLRIKRQANRTVGALRPRSHASVGQAILFWEGRELEHRRQR